MAAPHTPGSTATKPAGGQTGASASAQGGEDPWYTGGGALEDIAGISSAVSSGNWVQGGLSTASLIADTASAFIDPLGTALSWGAAIIMDHCQPLRGWLQKLAGNKDDVLQKANSWRSVACALEENAIVPSTQFTCDGYIKISDGVHTWTIRCHKRDGHGTLDAEQALMQSCNVYLMDTAFQEGAENFVKYQHIFGFGEKTGIDLPGEADTKDLIYTADTLGKTSLATNSFGQNYNVSMIQMAAGFSSIVNGGSYYKPHVVKQILNANGTVIKDVEPELVRVTNSKSTSDFLKEALYQTVEQGTGRPAKIQGYHVGGKTGTAQKLPRSEKNYLVSFCGFAPVEDPELLVYVIVDTPNLEGEAQASASFATKIEQKIMKDALQFLNIPPQGETDPEDSLNKNLEEEKKENAKEADKAEGNSEDEKQDSDEEVPDNLPESTKNEEN